MRSEITLTLIEAVVKEFGKIDVLVNNAGTIRGECFLDLSEEDWDKVLRVNPKAALNSQPTP